MLFAFPYALLGSVSVAALVATYLYRSRFHRKTVSSLMLWRQTALPSQGGTRRDTLRLPPIFFLELAILAALVLAAAAPLFRREMVPSVTLVVDDSASMRAVGRDGLAACDRAARVAGSLLRHRPVASIRIVAAGMPEPTVSGIVPASRVTAAVRGLAYSSAADSLEQAIARAGELAGPDGEVVVLSDHPPADGFAVAPPIRWIAVGEAAANTGIVHADRSPNPDGSESLLLRIRAFAPSSGSRPDRVRVALLPWDGKNPPLVADTLPLDASGSARLAVTLPPGTPDAVAVLPEDALATDNRTVLLASGSRPVPVGIAIADEGLRRAVRRAVEATGRASPVHEISPATDFAEGLPSLVFADAGTPAAQRATFRVLFHAPLAPRPVRGPYLVDHNAPWMEGVSFEGIVWNVGTNRLDGRALALVDSQPIATLLTAHRSDILALQASDARSPFFRSPAWPALVWNAVEAAAMSRPGPSARNLRIGESASFTLAAGERVANFGTPDGRTVTVRAPTGQVRWTPTMPGLHTLRTGGQDAAFAVNLFAEGESDLASCGRGSWGGGSEKTKDDQVFRSVAWAFGLAALALLALHQLLVSRQANAHSQGFR